MKTAPTRTPVALACALASALFIGGTATRAAEPAPSPAQATYEVKFMTNMIDHHMMAVMMGELCLGRAVHDELRQTCEQIITTQTQEIQTMQTWLSDWYGIAYEPSMTSGMERHMAKLAAASGAEFEIMFMTMMIRHHWQAVVKASTCVSRAYHEELITTCEDIMAAQSAEIIEMRTWLCEWYGVCRNGPGAPVTQ